MTTLLWAEREVPEAFSAHLLVACTVHTAPAIHTQRSSARPVLTRLVDVSKPCVQQWAPGNALRFVLDSIAASQC